MKGRTATFHHGSWLIRPLNIFSCDLNDWRGASRNLCVYTCPIVAVARFENDILSLSVSELRAWCCASGSREWSVAELPLCISDVRELPLVCSKPIGNWILWCDHVRSFGGCEGSGCNPSFPSEPTIGVEVLADVSSCCDGRALCTASVDGRVGLSSPCLTFDFGCSSASGAKPTWRCCAGRATSCFSSVGLTSLSS